MSQDQQELDFGASGRSASRPQPLCPLGGSSFPKGIEKLYGKEQERVVVPIKKQYNANLRCIRTLQDDVFSI
jgi:hypothetical protein